MYETFGCGDRCMSIADDYVRAGYIAVVQDVIVGLVLADVVAMRPRVLCT
jgi:hypothetical protein